MVHVEPSTSNLREVGSAESPATAGLMLGGME